MNSSQQPPSSWRDATDSPEFTKDPEETDNAAYSEQREKPTWEGLFGSAPGINLTGEPTFFEAIRDAWRKSKKTPEQEEVLNEFMKDIKDPKTYVELAVIITATGILKHKRGWGIPKTLLAFLAINDLWSYIEDPERWKRAYKAALQRG